MTLYHVSCFLALPTSRRPLNGRLTQSAVPPVARVCLSEGTPHRFPGWSDAASGLWRAIFAFGFIRSPAGGGKFCS